jgi:DNA repair photolyase
MPLKTLTGKYADPRKGRGAGVNPEGRFEKVRREPYDDGWGAPEDGELPRLGTHVTEERARSILARNESPDIPFAQSVNPYAGCEHGCPYCYARPAHGYRGLSPGLDFETRLFAKVNAAEKLREELARPGYRCEVIAIGANTDPYQPIERRYRITRGVLEVCAEFNQPVAIVTKNALVERDLDLLAPMARKKLVNVFISVNNLDHDLARRLEPRCSAPARRLEAMRRLSDAGVPVGVLVAPVIPFLTDEQVEAVLEAAHAHGARRAGYVLLRLPWEVKEIFADWLERNVPLKGRHVMARLREMRGGRENDPRFGSRMRGEGELARLLEQRFAKACRRLGLDTAGRTGELDTTQFRAPSPQASLF